jgi:hypothetical protein
MEYSNVNTLKNLVVPSDYSKPLIPEEEKSGSSLDGGGHDYSIATHDDLHGMSVERNDVPSENKLSAEHSIKYPYSEPIAEAVITVAQPVLSNKVEGSEGQPVHSANVDEVNNNQVAPQIKEPIPDPIPKNLFVSKVKIDKDTGESKVLNRTYNVEKRIGRGNFKVTYLTQFTKIKDGVSVQKQKAVSVVHREPQNANEKIELDNEIRMHAYFKALGGVNTDRIGVGHKVSVKDEDGEVKTGIVSNYGNSGTVESFCNNRLSTIPDNLKFRLELARGMAGSISQMHYYGIVHRDIKSDNFIVNVENGRIAVKAIDLGKSIEFENGNSQLSLYNPLRPPEVIPDANQKMKGNYSDRSDVFQLGVAIWQVMCDIPSENLRINMCNDATAMGWPLNKVFQTRSNIDNWVGMSDLSKTNPEIYALIKSMVSENPKDRPEVNAVYDKLVNIHLKVRGKAKAAEQAQPA